MISYELVAAHARLEFSLNAKLQFCSPKAETERCDDDEHGMPCEGFVVFRTRWPMELLVCCVMQSSRATSCRAAIPSVKDALWTCGASLPFG